MKKLSLAITGSNDKAEVQTALSQANSQLAKGVKNGIVSKKKMARTMSKYAKRANAQAK